MFYVQLPFTASLNLMSCEAFEDFKKVLPRCIDRGNFTRRIVGEMFPGWFGFTQSSNNWSVRRKRLSDRLGLNFASKKIPLIIGTAQECLKGIKEGDRVCLSDLISEITISVIAKLLFGEDCPKGITINYEDEKG